MYIFKADRYLLANGSCRFGDRGQRDRWIRWIEQTIELGAARAPPARPFTLGDVSFSHGLYDHTGQYFLDRSRLHFLEDAFFPEEIVKIRSYVLVAHFLPPIRFNRSLARSRSCFGVFLSFLMNPCSSTITAPAHKAEPPEEVGTAFTASTTNSTRAIRFARRVRTSQRSPST